MPQIVAQLNSFAVVSTITGKQLMHVVDAANPSDPAFNPPNSIQIPIDIKTYSALSATDLDAHIIQLGSQKGLTIQSSLASPGVAISSLGVAVLE